MKAPVQVLALILSVVLLSVVLPSCGSGGGGSAEDDYYIGKVIFINASFPLEGGDITITSVSLYNVSPGGSPDAAIPPGAEDLVAELFANGDLAEDVKASARQVAKGPDDDSYEDDEWLLAKVKVDDPERYSTPERTPNGTLTGWVNVEDAATP